MANMTIRIDDSIKSDAESLFEQLGMSVSGAINIFFRQAIREQGIPFQIKATDTNGFSHYDAARIIKAKKQLDAGGGSIHELIEG